MKPDPAPGPEATDGRTALRESLEIAAPSGAMSRPRFPMTARRHIARWALMWLGQSCNLRCFFCYYLDRIDDPTHPSGPEKSEPSTVQLS